METRLITAKVPDAYYDTIVTMFRGLGIAFTEKNRRAEATADEENIVLQEMGEALKEYRTLRATGRKGRPVEELVNEL